MGISHNSLEETRLQNLRNLFTKIQQLFLGILREYVTIEHQ
jgi:hypothetical protein